MTTVVSWNVNGIRSVLNYGFLDWLGHAQPDIVCLQESRAHAEDLSENVLRPAGYQSFWHPAQKKGYSGTACYTRIEPTCVSCMGLEHFDAEGRLQVIEFPEFTILNGYWPNSQAKRARLEYKLEFVEAVTRFASTLVRRKKNVILCGDFNIAHEDIDLARPRDNQNTAGYYMEERQAMTEFLEEGFVDTFRHFTKEGGHYSWWSYRAGARAKNIGWRIDYQCVNKAFMPRVKRSWIMCEVMGSDHCPVALEIE